VYSRSCWQADGAAEVGTLQRSVSPVLLPAVLPGAAVALPVVGGALDFGERLFASEPPLSPMCVRAPMCLSQAPFIAAHHNHVSLAHLSPHAERMHACCACKPAVARLMPDVVLLLLQAPRWRGVTVQRGIALRTAVTAEP